MDFRLSSHTIYTAFIYIALTFWGVTNLESVEDKPIQYYLLAVQWPATRGKTGNEKCIDRLRPQKLSNFTIHGLWPEPDRKCNGSPFDINELGKGLIKKMKLQWPSLERDCNNERFWQHEWRRHGACSNFSSPSAYFNAAVRLNEKYIQHWLTKTVKVTPGQNITNFKKIFTYFQDVEGIICNKKNNLYEIRFCIAKDASKNITHRKSFYSTNCSGSDIGFPAVIYSSSMHMHAMHDEL